MEHLLSFGISMLIARIDLPLAAHVKYKCPLLSAALARNCCNGHLIVRGRAKLTRQPPKGQLFTRRVTVFQGFPPHRGYIERLLVSSEPVISVEGLCMQI